MTYQALARKWRPRQFTEFVGQHHVVQALRNALKQERLHHAYLFSGTRGVGKTSIARLLAKCLNCETGVTDTPCDQCNSCLEINAGNFIDLIEVDAASRTRVEDTRELLNNVQYAPTKGRYKIYLIDEVHSLSGHSFNALLKTLEEPPPHVKFLLATTDPQKLPITVLSRCLQFHLKNLSSTLIKEQLGFILEQESIDYEPAALLSLATAANGSMRDALSLLDQSIAFSNAKLTAQAINTLLGIIDHHKVFTLLDALIKRDANHILVVITSLSELTTDFSQVLEQLLTLLHEIAICQLVPESADQLTHPAVSLKKYAQQISKEDVQLFYQIALIGKRDLPLAPSSQSGFEMIMLRMLTFQPVNASTSLGQTFQKPTNQTSTQPIKTSSVNQTELQTKIKTNKDPKEINTNATATSQNWQEIWPQLQLSGFSLEAIKHCSLHKITEDSVELTIDPNKAIFLRDDYIQRITQGFQRYLGRPVKVTIKQDKPNTLTPALQAKQVADEAHAQALEKLHNDPKLRTLIDKFDAQVIPESVEIWDNSR